METPASSIKALQSMNEVAREAAHAVSRSVVDLVAAFENFGRQFYAMLWDAYLKAGAPYGKTPKGLNQWLNERRWLNT